MTLVPHVWQKAHKSGTLNGLCQTTLMFGTGASMYGVNYLGLTRYKTAQEIGFLVVYVLDVLRTKETLLFLLHGLMYLKR